MLRTLTRVTIETVDIFDDAQLREAYGVTVADTGASAYPVTWSWDEYRVAARTPDPWTKRELRIARARDATAMGLVDASLPQRDNTELVWADVSLVPGREGDPAVTDLFETLADLARAHGRKTVEVSALIDGAGQMSAKARAVEAAGYQRFITNDHRVLDLPVGRARMRALADEVAPHHHDYRLVAWQGACPEAWIDGYANLRARLLIDAPDGGVGYDAEAFDAVRVRHEEAELAAQQRVMHTVIAIADDGAVAGHSQLVIPGTDEVNAFQWDTLVLRAHRGHRLGLALKARNLIETADALGSRTRLHTWNADENAPMIAVNERLGYRLVDHTAEFRRQV